MSEVNAAGSTPLSDVMLAMDVVDTLRHRQDLVARELDAEAREAQLIEKLRHIYHEQGIDVPDYVLREGVKALAESRFVYTPPRPSLRTTLARIYVTRGKWGRWTLAALLVLAVTLGGYFLVYRPWQAGQAEAARIELAETLPAQMDALYQTIYDETKVQGAAVQAAELRDRGKIAAREGDRAGAIGAVAALTELRDRLRQEFSLRVVNRDGVRSGFWTFPDVNTDATNYYIVVEAVDKDGQILSLPILNEENSEIETVPLWAVRVPQAVYEGVSADKLDDGIVQRNVLGTKQYGFLDIVYSVPVLGGTLTRW